MSLTGVSAQAEYAHFLGKEDEVTFDAGFMWQETKRELKEQKIEAAVRIFAPLGVPAELMQVRVTNKSDMDMCVRVTSAIPIYGRSADNLRDHRHVTSLLHRIRTTGRGVICKPVLSFDERGHQKNHMIYFEMGSQEMEQNRNRSSQRWNRLSEKPEHFWHRMRLKIKERLSGRLYRGWKRSNGGDGISGDYPCSRSTCRLYSAWWHDRGSKAGRTGSRNVLHDQTGRCCL